ncbi:ADP-ribosylation factor-like protein 6-interacting protein 4 isoform X2 [Stegostoma tigrinum]|uniref:ADP-ribosylation factor-like protein 6-interacting protein 4 isoform X2 n=1 Tax=Stegostoma tigrinum TaxID=3053191 RepID=UPI00202B9A85|nr:ADP-ribosylation factor-like protein 6-interacting protein 4 isoform X2 [Stegostoma tigrinum]
MGHSRTREDSRSRSERGSKSKVRKKEDKKRKQSSESPAAPPKRSRSSAQVHSMAELITPKNKIKAKRHSSSSSSSSHPSSEKERHEERSHSSKKKKDKDRRRKKKRKKEKSKLLKQKTRQELPDNERISREAVTSRLEVEQTEKDEQKARIQAMRPMTKEEWDARQSVIRRVVDPETGRSRVIKGDGEVLEEIVSRERHKEINKLATMGDGFTFQMRMGLNQRQRTKI